MTSPMQSQGSGCRHHRQQHQPVVAAGDAVGPAHQDVPERQLDQKRNDAARSRAEKRDLRLDDLHQSEPEQRPIVDLGRQVRPVNRQHGEQRDPDDVLRSNNLPEAAALLHAVILSRVL